MIFTLQTQRNWFCNWYYKNINIRFHFIWQKTGTDVTLFYKMHYIEEVVLDNQPYIVCGKQLQWIILIIKIIKTFADFRLHSAKERFSNLIRQLYVFCRFVVVIFHLMWSSFHLFHTMSNYNILFFLKLDWFLSFPLLFHNVLAL